MGYGNYVNGIRDAILAFNPNFGVDRATALAEGGIISLTPEKDAINNQEKDATQPGATGSKCP